MFGVLRGALGLKEEEKTNTVFVVFRQRRCCLEFILIRVSCAFDARLIISRHTLYTVPTRVWRDSNNFVVIDCHTCDFCLIVAWRDVTDSVVIDRKLSHFILERTFWLFEGAMTSWPYSCVCRCWGYDIVKSDGIRYSYTFFLLLFFFFEILTSFVNEYSIMLLKAVVSRAEDGPWWMSSSCLVSWSSLLFRKHDCEIWMFRAAGEKEMTEIKTSFWCRKRSSLIGSFWITFFRAEWSATWRG